MTLAPEELTVVLPVLGINALFVTNSTRVMEIIEDAFGGWRIVGSDSGEVAIRVRILVHDGDGVARVRHSFADSTRLVVHAPGSVGVSDSSRHEAIAAVTSALVAQEAFGETVVEALTFWLLSQLDRHPIHAAAIAHDNHAILLLGPSGAGKSTLAHLAHSAGITTLADDHVWIQQAPQLKVWGSPGRARLTAGASGEKRFVRLEGTRGDPACYSAHAAAVCVLARGEHVRLERVDSDAIRAALVDRVDPGFDRFPERHSEVANVLSAGGGWRLTLSGKETDALPALRTILGVAR